MKKGLLSIIILSYNTNDLLRDCLTSLEKLRNEVNFEVIVPDNGSSDNSTDMIRKEFPWVKKIIEINKNLGFAAGNNKAIPFVNGELVLFLNSDTVVRKNALKECVSFLDDNPDVGAVTCKILLPSGDLDKDARRSFISPWIGLTHLYLKLDRVFPKSRLFSKYWYGYVSPNQIHDVDALQGAFFMSRKNILDDVGWFDEDYFLDGEDIDLSWKIKEKGWRIVYYPKVSIIHVKGATKGKTKKNFRNVSFEEKVKYRMAGVNSMEIFVKKRLWKQYPKPLIFLVLLGIKVLKSIRMIRLLVRG